MDDFIGIWLCCWNLKTLRGVILSLLFQYSQQFIQIFLSSCLSTLVHCVLWYSGK